MSWPVSAAERVASIRRVYEPGMSSRDIAAALGISRNIVIGIYQRRRADLADCPLQPKACSVPGREQRNALRRERYHAKRNAENPVVPRERTSKPLPAPADLPALPPPEMRLLPLTDLERRHCRFIVSERPAIFCAADTPEGSSWCPFHRAIVYQPRIVKPARAPGARGLRT